MKTVLILSLSRVTQNSSRIIKEATTLQKNNIYPIVISILYPEQLEEETIQGIQVERVFLKTKKLPNSFVYQIPKFIELFIKVIKKYRNYRIVDCHCLLTLIIGRFIAKRDKSKLILNAHELETERNNLSKFHKYLMKIIERKLIYKCDSVIVVSDSIKEWYENEYKINNVYCIYNAPRLIQEIAYSDYYRNYFSLDKNSIIFLYQGGLLPNRGIDLLLETFKNLDKKYVVVFMGYGMLETKIKQYSKEYKNIYFHEAVPQNKLKNFTPNADYCLSLIQASSISYKYCMPNKLLEAVMYEVPVIVSNTKDQAKFVKMNKVGYVLEDYTMESLMHLIKSINIKDRSQLLNNIRFIKKKCSWEAQEELLISIYNKE